MIGWLQPAALYGLPLAAVPLAIHLLRARRAERVRFPTIHFIKPSNTAAVRLRTPSDWILLAVRTAIVAASVLALAQPVWLMPSRLDRWNARTARAIVVDVSESMRAPGSDGRPAAEAAEDAAAAEQKDAAYFVRFDKDNVAREIQRAVAWLRKAPPSRREIVIVFDAQRGTIEASDLAAVPADIGIRFAVVGAQREERAIDVFSRLGAMGIPARTQQVTVSEDETRLTMRSASSQSVEGLRLLTTLQETADAERLLRTVALAGAPAPSAERGLTFRFASSGPLVPANGPVTEPWMLRALLRLQQDDQLERFARRAERSAWSSQDLQKASFWAVIARDANRVPIVLAAESGREMIIAVGAPVSSLLAASAVRASLAARQGPSALPEAEVARVPQATLTAWSKTSGPVEQDAWRRAEASDARWLWLAVLTLMLVEQWLRSRPIGHEKAGESRAAA